MGKEKCDWAQVRERWETDPRRGYKWLIDEMGLDVTSWSVGQRRKAEGWVKRKKKNDTGRPTKYQEEFCEQARRLCLLGATNEELAQAFNVSVSSIKEWINVHPMFSSAVQEGRQVADSKVADRLYQRALGYEHDAEEIKVVKDEIVRVPIRKQYPPDTAAAFIWLKNRRPSQWRDKQELAHTADVTVRRTEELDEIYERRMLEMREKQAEVEGRAARLFSDEGPAD